MDWPASAAAVSTSSKGIIRFIYKFFIYIKLKFDFSWGNKLGSWKRRWLFIKDSFIGYLRPDTGEIGGVLLMDHDFKVSTGLAHTGLKNGLIISNLSRQMLIREWTKRKVHEWVDDLQVTMNTTGKDFIHQSRFGSFAPLRTDGNSTWFVDGCSFMSAVADAIESAEEEVMIADWWLSPEIYMKRPVFHGDRWRLDTLLQRKAVIYKRKFNFY